MATQPIEVRPSIRDQILEISRQNKIAPLTPWFSQKLDSLIADGSFATEDSLALLNNAIKRKLTAYRDETGVNIAVLGMSGGVDSALSAALLKDAGWRVIGVTMPINQEPSETERGVEACQALGIEHLHIDLSRLYEATLEMESLHDHDLITGPVLNPASDSKAVKIRRGNIRARLRMITLYNLASKNGGLVVSTDNLSELGAGFWTLHGDVGDLSPIQSLTKSWEVPYLARLNGVPEATVVATPTDGLGIDAGDEAQLGCSYLEWDIMTFTLGQMRAQSYPLDEIEALFGDGDDRVVGVFRSTISRIQKSWFKRMNPVNIPHPLQDRYGMIGEIDQVYAVAPSFRYAGEWIGN